MRRSLWFIFVISCMFRFTSGETGSGTELEQDCSVLTQDDGGITKVPTVPVFFPFLTDLLTKEECITFATLGEEKACSLEWKIEACNVAKDDYYYKYHAMSRTYLKFECQGANRSDMLELTRNISSISPNRAVTILLSEKGGASHPVHSDVIEPIRQQIVELAVLSNTSATTYKVFEAGILPRLLRFEVQYGNNLDVKKRDFSRMPEVRMICFKSSIIDTLERYTFMDLPALESLVLEKEISFALYRKEKYAQRNRGRPYEYGLISSEDIQKVRRLHCDCSFAWLRNFLKRRPHLVSHKGEGEVFVVGNFYSPFVFTQESASPEMLSVDCARELTYNNSNGDLHFAYNTSCYNLSCR
ncbi:uncharacterized protein LOC129600038 [Paramacrobiotus metropolitanus]|uniref:uncharacterized protein LOC129600038 n=1 Tax=Paramacrobiotus metropolitanus TaxID=2943436 RepID=UPI0024460870|nr:uncharacterized protein LOC129600038 [Paramacrobiotus metropolitanus]